jgi:hypothetical protein
MAFDPSHAVIERSLRDAVAAYLPRMPRRLPGTTADRSFRGWLRRVVLPLVLRSLVVMVIVSAIAVGSVGVFFPRLECPQLPPPQLVVCSDSSGPHWPWEPRVHWVEWP